MTRHEYVERVIEPRIQRENELYHHGIHGMKWGVRRYQNEDGSLTPEGEKRYLKGGRLSGHAKREVVKVVTKAVQNGGYKLSEEDEAEVKRVAKIVKQAIPESVKEEIKNKENKWLNAENNRQDFEDSDLYKKANNEAFDATVKMVKDDPEFFKDEFAVLNNPKLSEDDKVFELFNMKRFNKAYEPVFFDLCDKYEVDYMDTVDKMMDPEKLWVDYANYRDDAIADALGMYGKRKITYPIYNSYGTTTGHRKICDVIGLYIDL